MEVHSNSWAANSWFVLLCSLRLKPLKITPRGITLQAHKTRSKHYNQNFLDFVTHWLVEASCDPITCRNMFEPVYEGSWIEGFVN
jgi:hypothetical protein